MYKVEGSEILTKFWKFKLVLKLHIRLFGIDIFLVDPDEYKGGLLHCIFNTESFNIY